MRRAIFGIEIALHNACCFPISPASPWYRQRDLLVSRLRQGCSGWSGIFSNSISAADPVELLADGKDFSLVAMVTDSLMSDSSPPVESAELAMSENGTLRVRALQSDATVIFSQESELRFRCTQDGFWTSNGIPIPGSGETGVSRKRGSLRLVRARDESLIASLDFSAVGMSIVLIPYGAKGRVWLQYASGE